MWYNPENMISQYINNIFSTLVLFMPRAFREKLRLLRKSKTLTKFLGPRFLVNLNTIEIDITYDCNLKCFSCSRACNLFPSTESMSIEQIKKFIEESVKLNKKWQIIRIMGGEPTLHPDIFEIANLLLSYKINHSPETKIQINTCGLGDKTNSVIAKLPKSLTIVNTNKKSPAQRHKTFYLAPIDSKKYLNTDYSNGCPFVQCGIGLNPYGYYPCSPGAAIDRVFHLNLGEKKLPLNIEQMRDKLRILCKYCGLFKVDEKTLATKEEVSPSWKLAYEKYKIKNHKIDTSRP